MLSKLSPGPNQEERWRDEASALGNTLDAPRMKRKGDYTRWVG